MGEQKKTNVIKKPNPFAYTLPAYLVKAFSRVYWGLKTDNKEIKHLKSPILAIAPHMSTLDVVATVCTLLPTRYNVVTAKDLFTWKQLKPFIRAFGAIPINQCAMDLSSIKMIKGAIDNGNNVLLYPEGRTSLDGKNQYYLNPSIGKLIKFLNCNVVVVNANGCYATKPRYIKGFRRGKIESKASVLITKEELATLSPKAIYERVKDSLVTNDNIWQQNSGIKFKAKELASNLNYVLYKCPRCGTEYEMSASGDILKCNHCNNEVRLTADGHLVPIGDSISIDRIDLWMDYEKESILEELKAEDFAITKPVTAFIRNDEKHEYIEIGEGELFINKEFIGYNGTENGAFTEKKLPLKNMPTIITKNKEGIDLIFDNVTYRFMFTEKKYSTKYGLVVEMLFSINNGLI